MSWMGTLQTGAVYLIVLFFIGFFGVEMYKKWQVNEVIRKHKLKKLERDLAKEE